MKRKIKDIFIPAQLTSLLGAGRLLYACHNRDAVLAKLLRAKEKHTDLVSHTLSLSHCLSRHPPRSLGTRDENCHGSLGQHPLLRLTRPREIQ